MAARSVSIYKSYYCKCNLAVGKLKRRRPDKTLNCANYPDNSKVTRRDGKSEPFKKMFELVKFLSLGAVAIGQGTQEWTHCKVCSAETSRTSQLSCRHVDILSNQIR
jgi:hypothetical protein